jgi:hypothetical protein
MATSALTSSSNPVKIADERVTELKNMRTTKPKGSKKRYVIGVVVSANIEISGLRGKPVMLSWSMWQTGGSERLYGAWLNERLAYRLEATTDHDTAALDFWIPLPKARGPYVVRAQLTLNDTTLVAADTQPFR